MTDLALSRLDDGILTITLNRPDKHNALSLDLIEALHDAVEAAHRNAQARVVILTGAGRSFCAGMDLRGVITDVPAMSRMLDTLAMTALRIRALPVPTIAMVNGAAVGGGCGLMVVTDLAITHPDAKVG
ncbi:MAG: enoyl-CoA hydratase/isomerase family protein, partial [Phycisphaerales bacterium]|nr:enoyl-CoA hydratase/isomerase family protein [Phycisphaerales bacterium]